MDEKVTLLELKDMYIDLSYEHMMLNRCYESEQKQRYEAYQEVRNLRIKIEELETELSQYKADNGILIL